MMSKVLNLRVLLLALCLAACGVGEMSAQSYKLDELHDLIVNSDVNVKWLDSDGRYFIFHSEKITPTGIDSSFYMCDAQTRRRTLLFSDAKLRSLLTPFMPPKNLPLKGHPYLYNVRMEDEGGKVIYFDYRGSRLCYDIDAERIDTISREQKQHSDFFYNRDYRKMYSADSLFYIYAIDHNLYLARTQRTGEGLVTADTVQLTSDGEQFNSFVTNGTYLSQRSSGRQMPLGKWIGNTHTYLVVRQDKRNVPTLTIVNNLAEPRPTAETMKYSMPGDTAVVKFSVWLIDADEAKTYELDVDGYPDQIISLPRFRGVQVSGDYAYFVRKSRAQDQIDLIRIDSKTKTAKVLIHEDCKPHLNEQLFDFHVLNDGKDILWWAERGDRGQWWLYDGDGRLRNAITPPDLVAGAVERIDTLRRTMVVQGFGREPSSNPAYTYYYNVGFNGRKLTLLTPGDGNHHIGISPNGLYLVDTFSRMDLAGAYIVRDLKGRLVCDLGQADLLPLKTLGWKPVQQLCLKAADGETPLYGLVYTPSWMKPTDRLPIISNPYPGPHMDQIPLDFALDDNGNQTLAEDGFIVINFSYRGSNPYRGRKFYTHGYGNLRDYALDDDYAVIRQVAQLIPQADTTRVGIYGHSGGGFMAAAALLTRPDFYKVAVSASGNHDNNIYLKWWGETFHGVGQKIPTNMELAKNLKGHLLLIHGDMDNNVHPASTFRMANALIQAGKHFDMLIIPGADHGLGDTYFQNTIRAYFREHLLGEQLPVDIRNLPPSKPTTN